MAPESVTIYQDLDELPHFSPDRDGDDPPASVLRLRALIATADAIIVCTPEYAHGMPGSLKNALDWLVSSGDFDGKPAAAISASPSFLGGDKANDALAHTLTVLGATIPPGATLAIPHINSKRNATGEVDDEATIASLRSLLDALMRVAPAAE
jgi:chromate reductase, NAD(P)H dehydrogenase (quinone)